MLSGADIRPRHAFACEVEAAARAAEARRVHSAIRRREHRAGHPRLVGDAVGRADPGSRENGRVREAPEWAGPRRPIKSRGAVRVRWEQPIWRIPRTAARHALPERRISDEPKRPRAPDGARGLVIGKDDLGLGVPRCILRDRDPAPPRRCDMKTVGRAATSHRAGGRAGRRPDAVDRLRAYELTGVGRLLVDTASDTHEDEHGENG